MSGFGVWVEGIMVSGFIRGHFLVRRKLKRGSGLRV